MKTTDHAVQMKQILITYAMNPPNSFIKQNTMNLLR
jgi:hypothetical protein